MFNTSETCDPLDKLSEEFVARFRNGERPTIEDYAVRHPELAEEIRELFPTVLELEQLKLHKVHSSGSRPASIGPAPPSQLGDFRIVREIGRGGMGVVYEAEQLSLHRRVALKVLGTQLGMNSRQSARFRREAEAAARLHHTNIVPVYGIGEDQGLHFYAMQFIDGVPLSRLIQAWRKGLPGDLKQGTLLESPNSLSSISGTVQQLLLLNGLEDSSAGSGTGFTELDSHETGSRVVSPLQVTTESTSGDDRRIIAGPAIPPAPSQSVMTRPAVWMEIAATIASAADALAHSHHWGVLHRDVKPANVILDREGVAWITDFGLARLDVQDQSITGSGDFIGTMRYVAPEQLQGKSDPRSDIYGLGLTLFEWLTLTAAFPDEPLAEIVRRGTRELPRKPRSINPAVPADLETITIKACAADPIHRYQTAAEFAEDLRRFCNDQPIKARRVTPVERLWRWSRHNPTIAALTAISMLLMLSLVAVLGVSNRRIQKAMTHLDLKSTQAENAATEAQRDRELADANLKLAIRSFEDIMDNIAARGSRLSMIADDEQDEPVVVHASEVSAADAALLARLLEFFDQFAQQNQTDFTLETARIHRRIGDIHLQLGRADAAEAAYRQSESMYAKLRQFQPASIPLRIAHAECWNRLGVAMTQRGAGRTAFESHAQARAILSEPGYSNVFEVQLELAETLLLIDTVFIRSGSYELVSAMFLEGRRPPPPPNSSSTDSPATDGPRPNTGDRDRRRGPDRIDRDPGRELRPRGPDIWSRLSFEAVEILERLSQSQPINTQVKLLLSRAYRNRHYLHRRERQSDKARQDLQTAIDHMTSLGDASPESPTFRFELADLLCVPVPTDRPAEPDEESISRLERAITLLENLLNESPTIPEYQSLMGSALRRLAMIQLATNKQAQAESGYRRAIEIQGSLARRYPTTSLYQITYVKSLSGLADLLARTERSAESVVLLDRAVAVMDDFLVNHPEEFLVRPFKDRLTRRRDQIRSEMGQSPPADPPAT